jgi:hypothetical protein
MTPGITQDEVLFITPDEPEVGDVILFQSDSVEQNVLHRVTNVTDSGAYITKGDANDVTDQKSGMDPVQPDDVYGTAVTFGGSDAFSIPFIGAIISNQSIVLALWFIIMALGFAPAIFDNTGSKRGDRLSAAADNIDRNIIFIVGLVIIIAIPIAVMGAVVNENVTIISSQSVEPGADGGRTVAVGHSTNQTFNMTGGTLIGMTQTAHMEGDLRLEDVESSPLSSRTQITVSNPPSDGPAAHTGHITFYTFPATLPHSTLTTLAEIHPVLAAIASGGVISLALTVVTLIAIDPNQRLRRTKTRLRQNRRGR